MSGGVAFVLDLDGEFHRRCNREMVDLEALDQPADVSLVGDLIDRHVTYTHSAHAAKILAGWRAMRPRFVKIIPKDEKRVRAAEAKARAQGREPTFAELVGATSG
jgi:glutamate synthase (ferredoxin)